MAFVVKGLNTKIMHSLSNTHGQRLALATTQSMYVFFKISIK